MMKAAITGTALALVLWLGWSFQAPCENAGLGTGADAHRLGPRVESPAALPAERSGTAGGNLFLLLTGETREVVAAR